MDLLGDAPVFDIADPYFRIYSRNFARAPQYIGEGAEISNSLISEGCHIEGRVENSVLFGGVTVERGAVVRDAVIMEDVFVGKDARVSYAIVDSDAKIECGAKVGDARGSRTKIVVIPKNEIVSAKSKKEEA